MPSRIASLPRDRRGLPIPHTVAWVDGAPDFRVMREHGERLAALANAVAALDFAARTAVKTKGPQHKQALHELGELLGIKV